MELNPDWTMAYDKDGELRIVGSAKSRVCVHGKSLSALQPARFKVDPEDVRDSRAVRCATCFFEARVIAKRAPERLPISKAVT